MKKAIDNDRSKVESLEPMILMSASALNAAGTDGDDVLIAFYHGQTIDGLGGDDVLIGLGGNNVLKGGDGNDRFITSWGENVVDGGDGQDTLQFLNHDVSDFNIIDRGNGIIEISNAQQTNLVTNVESFQFLDQIFLLDDLLGNDGQNHAPTISDPVDQNLCVNENQTFVVDVNAEDLDGDNLLYSLADGADSALFTIDPQTGELSFISAPDFETPGDENGDNVYDVTVVVSDGQSTVEKTLWVEVKDVDETGGGNNAPFFTNIDEGQMIQVVEGNTMVVDADGEDPDGDTVMFSISDGIGIPGSGNNEDAGAFLIDAATGKLTFKIAPDFDNPADADGDNEYHVTLVITDGNGGAQERTVVVKIQDDSTGGNNAPFFTNVEEGEIVTVPENTTLVGDADGTDPDGDPVTYSIAGGADASLFTVNAQTGVVSFINAPDFETPLDADGNNDYQITLRISDGSLSQDRNVIVRVFDRAEGGNNNPFFTNVEEGEIVTVPENTTLVGDADGTDPDGDPVTYSIVGGTDAGFFTVNANTGVVSFINAPDFENPTDADGNNDYQIRLRIADDNGGFQDRNVTVRVFNRNEGGGGGNRSPFFTNVQQFEVVWFNENTTFVGDADAIDRDGDNLTYSIVGGADGGLFSINAQNGQVFFKVAPDFENPGDANGDNFYELTLRVSDGSLFQERTVFINVEDVVGA